MYAERLAGSVLQSASRLATCGGVWAEGVGEWRRGRERRGRERRGRTCGVVWCRHGGGVTCDLLMPRAKAMRREPGRLGCARTRGGRRQTCKSLGTCPRVEQDAEVQLVRFEYKENLN